MYQTPEKDLTQYKCYRDPTEEETESISRYLVSYYSSHSSIAFLFIVLAILFGMVICMGIPFGKIMSRIIGVCLMLIGVTFIPAFRRMRKCIGLAEEEKFKVADGKAKYISSSAIPHACNVQFTANDDWEFNHTFTVCDEGLEKGDPLLLVYSGNRTVWPPMIFAMTPFMLTEEGAEHPI